MKKPIVCTIVLVASLLAMWIARKPHSVAVSTPPADSTPAPAAPAAGLLQTGAAATTTGVTPAAAPAFANSAAMPGRADARVDWQRVVAFNGWAERYAGATSDERATMKGEGLRLARERRPEFKKLIIADPERALEQALKPVLRQALPTEVAAELEKPVSARGDYKVYFGRPGPGVEVDGRNLVLRYFETPAGASYVAHVFGNVEAVMTRKDVAVRGVAVDRELALADSAVRRLDVGEAIPAGAPVEQTCPVSGKTTALEDGSGRTITDDTPAVEVGGRVILLCNGSHVRVLDETYRLTSNISASGGPGGAHSIHDNFPGTSSEAIGDFKALYIRAVYPDRLQAPNTEVSAMEDMKNFERFYVESSYGRLSVTPAFTPLVVLPHTREWYEAKDAEVDGLGLVHGDSRTEARRLGFDSGQFNVVIVRVNGGPRLSGISWGGGDSVWVSWDGMDVLNHECGHSIGRPHANFWNTGGQSAIGIGANQEYGNSFDVMGGGGNFTAHYNTISKRALGWLPVQNTHNPTVSGVYRIFAYDQPMLEEGKRYGLRVPKDRTRGYNLEYHDNYGIEHSGQGVFRNSALVLWSGFGGAGHLIDTTPGTPGGKTDGGIEVGRTFSDPAAGVHFTVLARNATSPESLDIAVNYGNAPTNVAPTLALSATATNIALNGTITFTATAADANGDTLAYHWDFGDGWLSTNTAVFTRPFTAARQHTVLCTVSDMKGGTRRRHVVVTVGSPARGTVYGRVTSGGQGLQDILVSTSSKYAYTDTDGYYALSDLTVGTNTIAPLLYGWAFTPGSAVVTVAAGANTLNISAVALPQIAIAATADALENGTNGAFRLTRTGDTTAALDVRVMSAAGTATRATNYNFVPDYVDDGNYRTFTIPAGAASLSVAVVPINNSAGEGPETVTLQLAEGTNYIAGAAGSATLTIHDDDTTLPVVGITADDTEASETPGNVAAFTVSRTGPATGNLNVALAYGGTATRGADYPALPTSVTIPAGQAGITLILAPINDTDVEGSENCTVTLATGAGYIVNPSLKTVDLLILDDDMPVVTVVAIKPNASEANRDPGVFLISRTGPTSAPQRVFYGLGGSAAHGTDYVGLPAEATIPAGASSVPVFITPYDDAHGEGSETVNLLLTVFNGSYLVGTPAAATVTIADNDDPPLITLTSVSTSMSEPADNGTLRFHLTGSRPGTTTVRYTVSGTATPGLDYTALSGTVVLPAPVNSSSEVDVTVAVLDDALKEDVETVVVTLVPDPAYVFYNDSSTTLLLRDNDQPILSVSTWNTAPVEGTTNKAAFFIGRSGPTFGALTTGDLTVRYALSGSAANGADYLLLSGVATIPAGSSSVDIPITPLPDALFEGTETVTLTILSSPDYGVGLGTGTLYLADDEAFTLSVGFLAAAGTNSEALDPIYGEYRLLPVILSGPNTNVCTVEYVVGSGTTAWANGIDWDLVDAAGGDAPIQKGTLTFPVGVTNQNIKLRIYSDALIEGSENAVIELRNPGGCRLSTTRNPYTLTLLDNTNTYSPVRVMFITVASSVDEDAGSPPLLMAGLDRPAPTAVTVNYAVTGGTATAGSDFTLPAGTLTFAAGEVSKPVPLVIINDTAFEGDETVIVTLSSPVGADLGPIPSHLLTIHDNDSGTPEVIVTATDMTATEGADTASFTVTRTSGGAATALTVNYTVSGTATPGSDYVALPGTVTIPAGQAGAPVTVTTLDDALLEPIETVTLTLVPGAGYSFGAVISATVNIVDDETQRQPPVAFNQSRYVARNQASSVTLTGADPTGDPLTYQVASSPTHGTLTGVAPGLTYTPVANYTGPDSFTFRVSDGANTSAVATVTLTVQNPTLVASNSSWRYNDAGVDLGAGWVASGFNDATWSNGVARLGFGDPATTVVRGQPVITYYFRQKFVPPAGITFTSLTARVQRDDGVVVYLNGTEAMRDNMPAGTVLYSTRPGASAQNAEETTWFTFSLNASLLTTGTNVIAAEVHQIDGTSSDLGFALELTGSGVPTPAALPTVILTATDAVAAEPSDPATFTITRLGTDLGSDLAVAYGVSGTATPGADYLALSSVVTIPAGRSNALITITPLDDYEIEPVETIVITLAPGLGYVLDTNITATATLTDDDAGRVAPTALAQAVSVPLNQSAALVLAGNDPENDPLTFQIVTTPASGSLSGTAPYVTYTPNNNFVGADSFSFRVTDGGLWSAPATVSVSVFDPAQFIASNAVWRFNDAGTDLGTAWRTTGYNDNAWSNGVARLGFGGDGEVTTLRGQPVITYYFRKSFIVPDGYTATNATVSFTRDDAAVVYLDGAEVARDTNMPSGTVTYAMRPLAALGNAEETVWLNFALAASLVRPGTHVLAAEVHQFNNSSSDIGFNLALRAEGAFAVIAPPPVLAIQMLPSDTLRITFPAPNGLRYAIEGSQTLQGWQALATNTVSGGQFQFTLQSTNPPVRFFRARQVP